MNKFCIICLNFIISLGAMNNEKYNGSSSATQNTLYYSSELTSSLDFNFTPDATPINSPRKNMDAPKETNRLIMCLKKIFCRLCCWCCAKREYQSILAQDYPSITH